MIVPLTRVLWLDVIDSAQTLVLALRRFKLDPTESVNRVRRLFHRAAAAAAKAKLAPGLDLPVHSTLTRWLLCSTQNFFLLALSRPLRNASQNTASKPTRTPRPLRRSQRKEQGARPTEEVSRPTLCEASTACGMIPSFRAYWIVRASFTSWIQRLSESREQVVARAQGADELR